MMSHNFKLIITAIILSDNKLIYIHDTFFKVHYRRPAKDRRTFKLNVVFSRKVSKLSGFFFHSMLTEIYRLKLKMRRKYDK